MVLRNTKMLISDFQGNLLVGGVYYEEYFIMIASMILEGVGAQEPERSNVTDTSPDQ